MSRDRGQTTLDFAIGIGVFLIVVTFVFAFVPGALTPFEDSAREETTAADRVATQLSTGALSDPAEPYVLDPLCTTEFFEPGATSTTCEGFDQSASSIDDRAGLGFRINLRVELLGDANGDGTVDTLCWDDSAEAVVEESSCNTAGADVAFVGGGDAPGTGSTVSATRFVTVDGVDSRLEVVTW